MKSFCISCGTTTIFSRCSKNLSAIKDVGDDGIFISATMQKKADYHSVCLGKINNLKRFAALFRYDPFWVKPITGTSICTLPEETQFFLAELRGTVKYTIIVPLVKGDVRCSLRGCSDGSIEVVAETGDRLTRPSSFDAAYVACGNDLNELLALAAQKAAAYMGSARLRAQKPLPPFVDKFGWCTWDAFYHSVNHKKIREGLSSFKKAGVSPRYLILDDGWLNVTFEPDGTEIKKRLQEFSANPKKFPGDLGPCITMAKEEFGIEKFFVWHAIMGYWGGIDAAKLSSYQAVQKPVIWSKALYKEISTIHTWYPKTCGTIPVDQIYRFYQDFHRHLRRQGVDGIKVDNQGELEAICNGSQSRVKTMQAFHEALEGSAQTHFNGILINCMCGSNDMLYHALASTVTRTFTDFWPDKPESHGLHVYANAVNSLWLGQFVHPDWDMFQSGHSAGPFHAASRAISGGPVYVSDKPNSHNRTLLKKLVLDDGSILRCTSYALPCPDSIFVDALSQNHLFKMFNRNAVTSVIGAFNCRYTPETPKAVVFGTVSPGDVPGIIGKEFAIYSHYGRQIHIGNKTMKIPCSIGQIDCELFTISPLEDGFAPIGLVDKFNSGGAILRKSFDKVDGLLLKARGSGMFAVYAQKKPRSISVNRKPVRFLYDAKSKLVRFVVKAMDEYMVQIE